MPHKESKCLVMPYKAFKELMRHYKETCVKGLSREARLTPPDLAVFLCVPFRLPAKVPPSPIYPPTQMLNGWFLHVIIKLHKAL